jgi:hypothetical protein
MKNKIICENCNSENDFFNLNCNNCGSLLRDKKPNIDLFATVWALIEEPTKSLRKIVFAEHKNYQFFVLLLLLLKLVFTSFFLQSLILTPVDYQNYLSLNLGIGFLSFSILILLFPFLQKIILSSNSVATRYKDNLALLIYSQMPLVLFLLIILPIEFALFGKFWLFSNPSPFIIKETAAYTFSIMEILTFLWSFVLFGIASYVQSKSKQFAILNTVLYIVVISLLFFFIPFLR